MEINGSIATKGFSDGPHLLMEIRVIRILFYFFNKEISHVMPCYATVHNAVLSDELRFGMIESNTI